MVQFVASALILLTTGAGRAQDGDAFDVDVEEAGAVAAQPVFADENFDQWLFNNNRNADGARAQFNSQLKLKIESVVAICGVTPIQKQKLQLAGRGDIVRFFEQVEVSRKKFQSLKHDQNKINEIFNDIRPLQARIALGLFGPGSLFDKTLRTTLTSKQAGDWDESERSRRLFQYQAKVELIISMIDDLVVLDDAQRQALTKFVLDETKPPRQSGQYDYYVVMFQLTRVPEEKFKRLLRPAQIRVLNKQLNQVRGIEQFLLQQGLIDPEDAKQGNAQPAAAARAEGEQ